MRWVRSLALLSALLWAAAAPSQQRGSQDFYELGDYDLFAEPAPARPASPGPSQATPAAPAPAASTSSSLPANSASRPPAPAAASTGPVATYEKGDLAAARAEAKALAGPARAAAARLPTVPGAPEGVPHYAGTTLPQSTLFDDPDALVSSGTAASAASDAYRAVIDPGRAVVTVARSELARGLAVEKDPDAFLQGETLGGEAASCRPLPPVATGTGTYEAACNVGTKVEQRTLSCAPAMVPHVVDTERFLYYGVASALTAYGFAPLPALAARGCQPSGVVRHICDAQVELGGGGDVAAYLRYCKGNVRGNATQMTCAAEVPRAEIPDHFNYATGTVYLRKEGSRTVELRRDDSSCAALAGDTKCRIKAETCTSSDPVTRVFDGVEVTAPCWAWSRSYQCAVFEQASDCAELDGRTSCRFLRETCLDDPQQGACQVRERVYQCPVPGGGTAGGPEFICGDDVYCINGECEPIVREASTEFKDALVGLHTLGQADAEFDEATLTLFSGTRETCHKPVFGMVDCCAGRTSGALTAAAGLGAIAGGPAAIGALATPFLSAFMCSTAEKTLDIKDRMGFCHKVGTWCSDSFLGVCTSKRTAYCCFESKLSRVLQEQGRPQLGKPWDAPKTEQCRGFTVDEFSRLDLSRIDFREVYAEFIDAAKLPDELETARAIQARIEEYYRTHGPGT